MTWRDEISHDELNQVCWFCSGEIGPYDKFCRHCGAGPADPGAGRQTSEKVFSISRAPKQPLESYYKNGSGAARDDADQTKTTPASKRGDRENAFVKIARWTVGLTLFATGAISVLDPLIKTGNPSLIFIFFLALIFFFGLIIYFVRRSTAEEQ